MHLDVGFVIQPTLVSTYHNSKTWYYFPFWSKPLADTITSTIFHFLSKPQAYTGQTYLKTYFMPQKDQSWDICHGCNNS